MIKVTDKTQNITGYWGPVDTTTSFCEAHYSSSPYFAEFFNAWSSLIYVIVGAYLIGKFHRDTCVTIAAAWLIVIGFGSFAFHATMRYSMQLLDELPMVGLIHAVIVARTMSKDHKGIRKYATLIQIIVTLQAVALVTVYMYFKYYQIFVDGFTLLVIQDAVLGFLLHSAGPHLEMKRTVLVYSVVLILLGKVLWEVENQLCGQYQAFVWPLHVFWHFFSASSAYNTSIFIYLCRIGESDTIPDLVGYSKKKVKKQ